mgnify:CR=1 FL=1
MEDGWEFTINGITYEDIEVSEFYKLLDGPLERGDHIIFKTTLPDLGFLPFPAIWLRSIYTTLECYVDDLLVYEYAKDMYEKGGFVGKSYHLITIPREYAGKELTIVIASISPKNAKLDSSKKESIWTVKNKIILF